MYDRKIFVLIWIFLGGMIVSSCIAGIYPSLTVVAMGFGVALGLTGMSYVRFLKFTHWKLNRKNNPLSLWTRIRLGEGWKVSIKNQEGKPITLTSRGVITILTILTWIVTEGLCVELKINSVTSFVVACIVGSFVLFCLLTLYFIRRHRHQIVKFVPKPKVTRVGIVTVPLLLLGIVGLPFWFEPNGWIVGIVIGGIPAGLLALGLALRVKKSGWKKFSWNDAIRPLANRKWHSVKPHGNPFAMRGNFDNSYLNRNLFKDDE